MDILERTILNNLKSGDDKAFEFIYKSYFKILYNYAGNLLHSKYLAEEVVSDVFVKLWETRLTIKIESSLKAYLFRAVYNHCLNHISKVQIEDKYKAYFWNYFKDGYVTGSEYPLENLIEKELEFKIAHIIESLPTQCREMFLLSRNEGLTHEEIANKYDVSINSVHTQINRALKKFKEELKNYLPIIILMLSVFNKFRF